MFARFARLRAEISVVAWLLAACAGGGSVTASPTATTPNASPATPRTTSSPESEPPSPEPEPTEDSFEDEIIPSGVYVVGDEVPAGLYRVAGYWARLDENQEIIDNDVMSGENGLMLMRVHNTDAYVEISGEAIPLSALPKVDALDYTEGTYLVRVDVRAGRYRISPTGDAGGTYWARLDENFEIIDNNVSDGQLIAIVDASDYAFTFTGEIEPLG